MTHTTAKHLLAQQASGGLPQRQKAVEAALALGMPLHEIEEYLDWLDATRPQTAPQTPPRQEATDTPSPPAISASNIAARCPFTG